MTVGRFMAGYMAALMLAASPAAAQERLVLDTRDPATQAAIRVVKLIDGGRIIVEHEGLSLAKAVRQSRVETTLADGGESLQIVVDRETLTVFGPHGGISARNHDRDTLERARQLIAASPLTARAAALIGRLGLGPSTPLQPVLITTRAFLLAALGEGGPADQAAPGFTTTTSPAILQARVVPVAYQRSTDFVTPTECWEAYVAEAIAAATEYKECIKELRWWEFLDHLSCAAIYDMRALGAFAWWLKCVGLD